MTIWMLVVVVLNKAELMELAVKRLLKLILAVLEAEVKAQTAVKVLMVTLQLADYCIYISTGRVNNK